MADTAIQIIGTPTQAGPFQFTIQATDSASHVTTALYTIQVSTPIGPAGPIKIHQWRFLLANPQPDGDYLAEVAQTQNRALILRTEPDQASEASFDILGTIFPAWEVQELLTDLHVYWENQLLFVGRIGSTQDQLDSSGHFVNVNAADYREVLRRRMILPNDTGWQPASNTVSYTSTIPGAIAWQMIKDTQGRTGGNLGIAQGIGQGQGQQIDMVFNAGDYIGDQITTMAQLQDSFEWQITPYGPADLRFDVFYPEQGQDNGVVLSPGDGRVVSIARQVDPSAYANAIYETASGLTPQYAESADIGDVGRWDKTIGADLHTAAAIQSDVQAQLLSAVVLVPTYTITLVPGAWGGPSDIFLGDTVTVQINSGRLNVNDRLRVVEMAWTILPDGIGQLALTVGALPLKVLKHIPRMLKRIRYLEKR